MRILPAIGLVGPVILTAGCLHCIPHTRVTVPQVEQQLDAALPIGSTRAEIETWLAEEGLVAVYQSLQDPKAFVGSDLKQARDTGRYTGAFTSLIQDTDRSFWITGDIQLVFLLGPDDRLARRVVTWVGTGP